MVINQRQYPEWWLFDEDALRSSRAGHGQGVTHANQLGMIGCWVAGYEEGNVR
jgi:hypothetical protein